MRVLYYVPILHLSQEAGDSLVKLLAKIDRQSADSQFLKTYEEEVYDLWITTFAAIVQRKINTPEICKKLHIYADGLSALLYYCEHCFNETKEMHWWDEVANVGLQCPVCKRILVASKEELLSRLVQAWIKEKYPLYLIIEKLINRGAKIHDTESRKLLLEEYALTADFSKGKKPDFKRSAELLKERDKFIAKRIEKTLPENEIGILFMGIDHEVDKELKKISNIKIISL